MAPAIAGAVFFRAWPSARAQACSERSEGRGNSSAMPVYSGSLPARANVESQPTKPGPGERTSTRNEAGDWLVVD
jgi:hypothetical protein